MARKKIEPIISLGSDSQLTVQKSLPLFALWRSDLTLSEFKILDTYLSRIDSHKPERRSVRFERGELEAKLGVKKINLTDLKNRLRHLMGSVVEIPDSSLRRGFRLVTLFEDATAEQDDSGLWQINLTCTQQAMRYFFNIEALGYLRYKLRCITSLTSRYTYIMFIYLEANRYRRSWDVPIDELRTILNCDGEETYKTYKRFNDLILKKSWRELTEKTECQFKYEPIKCGRSVVAVRFTVFPLRQVVETAEEQNIPERGLQDDLSFYNDALDNEMTSEQMSVIMGLVREIDIPEGDGIDRARYRFLQRQWSVLQMQDSVKPIRNKFLYLKKMLEGAVG